MQRLILLPDNDDPLLVRVDAMSFALENDCNRTPEAEAAMRFVSLCPCPLTLTNSLPPVASNDLLGAAPCNHGVFVFSSGMSSMYAADCRSISIHSIVSLINVTRSLMSLSSHLRR